MAKWKVFRRVGDPRVMLAIPPTSTPVWVNRGSTRQLGSGHMEDEPVVFHCRMPSPRTEQTNNK